MVNDFVMRFMDTASGILEIRAFGPITGVAAAPQPADRGIQGVACRAWMREARRIFNVKIGNENRKRLSINAKHIGASIFQLAFRFLTIIDK